MLPQFLAMDRGQASHHLLPPALPVEGEVEVGGTLEDQILLVGVAYPQVAHSVRKVSCDRVTW